MAGAKIYENIKNLNVKSIKLNSYLVDCDKMSFQAIAEGILLGSYEVDKYALILVKFS